LGGVAVIVGLAVGGALGVELAAMVAVGATGVAMAVGVVSDARVAVAGAPVAVAVGGKNGSDSLFPPQAATVSASCALNASNQGRLCSMTPPLRAA
jgi:hypothetical protein